MFPVKQRAMEPQVAEFPMPLMEPVVLVVASNANLRLQTPKAERAPFSDHAEIQDGKEYEGGGEQPIERRYLRGDSGRGRCSLGIKSAEEEQPGLRSRNRYRRHEIVPVLRSGAAPAPLAHRQAFS